MEPDLPENTLLTFQMKYGFDGCKLEAWNQKSSDLTKECEHAFVSGLVPLKLYDVNNKPVWKNPRPNSSNFFRYIRIQFKHETNEVTKDEAEYLDAKIKQLEPLLINGCIINFEFILSMLDGKVSQKFPNNSILLYT